MNAPIAAAHSRIVQPTVEELEVEITTLAAHLNAATYRFLVLVADFDRRGGWAGWGVRSCAHWLNWKCGIGLVAAREKLRVAHALETLPMIAQAMERGGLSYAKVRAMTRIANQENERFLLTIAESGTAAHVETIVRHYRRTLRLEELESDRVRHDRRCLRYYWDDDGSLVIEGRLPPEQGAVVVKALEAADVALCQARASQNSSGALMATVADVERRNLEHASAESPSATSAAVAPSATASVEVRPTTDSRSEDPLLREVVEMLELAEREVADVSAESPNPQNASAESSSAASPVDQCPAQNASAESCLGETPTWGNRQADAFALMAETVLARGPTVLRNGDKHLVHIHVDLGALAARDAEGKSTIEDGPAIPPETVRRLCCDGGLVTWLNDDTGRTLDVGRKTRAIPPALRRALDKRDRGCRFPGCENRRFVHAHHIEHWVDGGETKLDNLVLLCSYHHRLLHEGGFQIAPVAIDGCSRLRFARPDGQLIPDVPPLPDVGRVGGAGLAEQHASRGLTIETTAVSHWGGERADYNYMLMVLDQCDERGRRARSVPA
jgi:hypothetical protein